MLIFPIRDLPNRAAAGICPLRGRMNPRRRQGLANRLGSELGEDRLQGADAIQERVAVVLDDTVQLLGESGGFFVG